MSLTPGQRLGSFEVVSLLGAGGMGEVYLASDTVLGRSVAIKVLPEIVAHYPDSVARFEREAKTLAALNHPHIAQIFGFEKTSGAPALVMELVEGPTLAERVARGPMPLDEALPIAAQIADALEAAHAQGIIHRDLKPANVKVRSDGTVKVLDFGLAKAFASQEPPIDVTQSPTLTSPIPISRAGLIVGTTAYMSPEQARGKAIDKRTDIWAFGCVLYEMLSGRRAFVGDDATETIAAIVKTDLDWAALPAETPAAIRRLLKHLLAKDPRQRLADIADARLEIADAMSTSSDAAVPAALPAAGWRPRMIGVAIGATILGAIGGIAISRFFAPAPPASSRAPFRFAITLGPDDVFSATGRNIVAVSPTGAYIAYVANQRVYLRPTDQVAATVVADSEKGGASSHGRGPFFSADGEWLGYWQSGELRKVPVRGGASAVICTAVNPLGASWTAANTIYFGQGGGIWRVAASGGVPEIVVTLAPGESAHGPQLLPDGKSLLFTLKVSPNWDDARIVVQTPGSGDRTEVIPGARDARYVAATGHLIYARRGTLFGIPFDAQTRTVRGQAVPLVENVGDAGPSSGAAQFSMSNTGLLVYAGSITTRPARAVVWVDRQGHEERISSIPARAFIYPRISPDGQKMAITVEDPASDVWLFDLQRGSSTRLTFDGDNTRSIWRPDGHRIVFASNRDGINTNLYSVAADGSGSPERLTTSPFQQVPEAWAPNGEHLAYSELRPQTGWDIFTLSLADRKPTVFLQTRFHDGGRIFSPNGEWLAYYSDESGRGEVQVRSFPSAEGKSPVSSDGGAEPVWAHNGRELFYRNGTKLMVVDVPVQPPFHAGTPRLLFDAPYETALPANFDVSPDGRRFIMLKAIAPAVRETPHLIVVQNWFDELERLVPSK